MIIKNDKLYDILKWVVTVVLPALTALWLGLSKVWGFPYAEEIGATVGNSFHYEVVCDIGRRVPRVYYRNGAMVEVRSLLPTE